MFEKLFPRKNTSLLSPIRMMALGVLESYIAADHEASVTFTQATVHVSPLTKVGSECYECTADVAAFYFWNGMERRYGRMYQAPVPPYVSARILFKTSGTSVLYWEPTSIELTSFDDGAPRNPSIVLDPHNYANVESFVKRFNEHRCAGFTAMYSGHDRVIWNINPSEKAVRKAGY
jgi:hypothetical protein